MRKFKIPFTIPLLLASCLSLSVASQDLTLDPTFSNGTGYDIRNYGFYDAGAKIFLLENAKTLVAGISTTPTFDSFAIFFTRYNSDGMLDNTYGVNGTLFPGIKYPHSFGTYFLQSNWVTADIHGNIVLLSINVDEPTTAFTLRKLTSTGSPDITFGNSGVVNYNLPPYKSVAWGVELQSDAKVLVTGYYASPSASNYVVNTFLIRFATNGALDNSFGNNGVAFWPTNNYTIAGTKVLVQTDGKIIVGGDADNSTTQNRVSVLTRFNTNGKVDSSFGTNGITETARVNNGYGTEPSFFIDNVNSKVYTYGTPVNYSSNYPHGHVATGIGMSRFNFSGLLDQTFGLQGYAHFESNYMEDFVGSLVVQTDKKILLTGESPIDSTIRIARFLENGYLDTTLNDAGVAKYKLLNGAGGSDGALQTDGKLLVTGTVVNQDYDIFLARISPVGLVLADKYITATKTITGNSAVTVDSSIYKLASITSPSGTNALTGTTKFTVAFDAQVSTFNSQPYVQRHYDIAPGTNAATAQATVTLYFTQQEFDNYNAFVLASHSGYRLLPTSGVDNGNARILQFHGNFTSSPTPSNYPSAAPVIINAALVWNSTKNWWEATFPVSGFSGFFLSTASTPLPLTLLQFTGKMRNDEVSLSWETVNEINTKQFLIEKSQNNNFDSIGSLPALSTSGNHYYTFSDTKPFLGNNFYRLKMIDNDGRFTYSNVVSLRMEEESLKMTIYPNPADKKTTLMFNSTTSANYTLKFSDESGKVIKQINGISNLGKNTVNISLQDFMPGVYWLEMTNATKRNTLKIIKR